MPLSLVLIEDHQALREGLELLLSREGLEVVGTAGSAGEGRELVERHSPDVALVWKFTRATLAHDPAADESREEIVKRWGRRALVSVAFAITTARIYPTVKYALSHGKACSRVVVAGTPVTFDHGRVAPQADVAVRMT